MIYIILLIKIINNNRISIIEKVQKLKIKNKLSFYAIGFIALSALIMMHINKTYTKKNRIIASDVIEYYAYLPALFIYNDIHLHFNDNLNDPEVVVWWKDAPNGNRVLKMTCGTAIMYSPFFFLGHVSAKITNYKANGYSIPYRYFLMLGAIFYLIAALILLRKILIKYVSDKAVAIAILLIVLATNLFFYSTLEGTMSHVYSFFLFSAFFHLTIKWHKKQTYKTTFLLSIVFGLISLIRPTNAVIALFFIFYDINKLSDFKNKVNLFLKQYKQILIIIGITIIIWMPQLFYWKEITNQWFYYSYSNDEVFYFLNPQFWNGLFSYRKGLLVYIPILLPAFISILFLRKSKQLNRFFIPILIFTIVNMYILFSWWCWWYGGSFANRAFIESFVFLTIPMAYLIDKLLNKNLKIKIISLSFAFLFVLHGIFQTLQYYYGSIHWDSMTKEAYWDSFLRIHPSPDFYDKIEAPDYEKATQGVYD